MPASESSPDNGYESDGRTDWEPIARELLDSAARSAADQVAAAFNSTADAAANGEELTAAHVFRMREALQHAKVITEVVAEAPEETTSRPHWTDVVDEECLEQYLERVGAEDWEGEE